MTSELLNTHDPSCSGSNINNNQPTGALTGKIKRRLLTTESEKTSRPMEWFLTSLGMREPRHFWGRLLVRYGYAPLMFLCLCFMTGLSIASMIAEQLKERELKNHVYFSYLFFSLIIPSQYYLGWRYYRQNHFYSLLTDCRRARLEGIPNQLGMICMILGLTISLVTVNLILWGLFGLPPHFQLLGISRELGSVLLISYWLLAWLTVSTNLVVFSVVFSKHLRDLWQMSDFMENQLVWHWDQVTINDLARWMVNLKFGVNGSIDRLESFYTAATILGAIGLGPMVEFQNFKWDSYLIFYVVAYVLMQVVFMVIIHMLTKAKGDIYKLVKSPMIMSRYLAGIKDIDSLKVHHLVTTQANAEQIQTAKIRSHCPHKPTQHTIDRPKMRSMPQGMGWISEEPATEIVRPRLGSGSCNKNSTRLNQKEEQESLMVGDSVTVDIEQHSQETAFLAMDELGEELLEDGEPIPELEKYKNNAGVDWLILDKILSERWADFSLLGVQFGGTDVIKKGVGLTALLVMAISYLNNLTFNHFK